MNDELPEDITLWPTSPWRILGVNPAVDRRQLRDAYVKLIRRFKPEHYPEQYRRIREAYEQLRERRGAIGRPQEQHRSAEFAGEESVAVSQPSRRASTSARQTESPITPRGERFEEIWQQACQGKFEQAYIKLTASTEQSSPEPRVFAGLYWLLRRDPSLDSKRLPMDWIECGLDQTGIQDPLANLLIREAAAGTGIDITQWTTRFLVTDLRRAIRLIQSWCEAQIQCRRWDELWSGLNEVRGLFAHQHSEHWFRLMLFVLDQISWEQDDVARNVRRECWDEVQSLNEWHLEFSDTLMWYDEYPSLSDAVQLVASRGNRFASLLLGAVREGWKIQTINGPDEALPESLENFVAEVTRDPLAAIRQFDEIKRATIRYPTSRGGKGKSGVVLLTYLNHLFGGNDELEPASISKSQTDQIVGFFYRTGLKRYVELREPLLTFCLREIVRPREILGAIQHRPSLNNDGTESPVSESLIADVSLRLVLQIHECLGTIKLLRRSKQSKA